MSAINNDSTAVTRIARRRALPGHEHAYEELVRMMFELMKKHHGFLGAEIIPPVDPGCAYQVVVNFESEADLQAWDNSADRKAVFTRMRRHAEGEPEHRRLNAMEEWFTGPSVPANTKPPRWKTAIVTWLGIWPLASLFIWLAGFWNPGFRNLPFLATTAINVALIVLSMTFLVAPVLTKLMRPFLVGRPRDE